MNKHKKIICFLLYIALTITFLTGCGKDNDEDDKEETSTITTTEYISTEEIVRPGEIATAQDATFTDEDGFTVRNDYVKVTSDSVNVRTSPDANAPIFRIMQKDEVMNRTGDNAMWTRVNIENTSFYVYSEYLEVTTNQPVQTTSPDSNEGEDTAPEITSKKKILVIDAGNQASSSFEVEPIGPNSETTKQCVSAGNVGIALGVKAYEINLIYAQLLKEELEGRGYTIIMTRDSNLVNLSNSERAKIANDSGATAVIRIQTNYSSDVNMTGAMTLCMTYNSPYNAELFEESYKLSTRILQGITQDESIINRGIYKTDQLTFVNWCKLPVSVIKIGYISNVEEEAKLSDSEYQNKLVKGIADGIDYYFNN